MVPMKKVLPVLMLVAAICIAHPIAKLLAPTVFSMLFGRTVDSRRVEGCLVAYHEYQQNQDQKLLAERLQKLETTPQEFQRIIDRFIHYRLSKSSMDQAMRFLKAFEDGYKIRPVGVVEKEPKVALPYDVEAEIIAVFREKPHLVRQAFGS